MYLARGVCYWYLWIEKQSNMGKVTCIAALLGYNDYKRAPPWPRSHLVRNMYTLGNITTSDELSNLSLYWMPPASSGQPAGQPAANHPTGLTDFHKLVIDL